LGEALTNLATNQRKILIHNSQDPYRNIGSDPDSMAFLGAASQQAPGSDGEVGYPFVVF
jgi:hypothetical protein